MWVSAQIVDRMRGSMSVWSISTPKRTGTVFSVFLPFDPAPDGVSVMRSEQEAVAEPVTEAIS